MTSVRLKPFNIGTAASLGGRSCIVTRKGEAGIALFGPYEERSPGHYRVEFALGLADDTPPLGDPICMVIDVRANNGHTLIAQKYVLHSMLKQGWTAFPLEFELQETRALEYRVMPSGQVPVMAADAVGVTRLGEARKIAPVRTAQQLAWENEREFLDGYLRNVSGLIHVGANLGQERRYYWLLGLDVIWVEPIREIYESLVDHLSVYPRQRAVNALLTSRAGEEVEFRIANNNGASSSILPLEDHAVIFPDITYVEHRKIRSTTFADMIRDQRIPLDRYEALTLDVEGAEQMVLEGAGDLIQQFTYVKCEVADFPARTGTPTVADLERILRAAGFAQLSRKSFAEGPGNQGTFWDIVWKKVVPGQPLHEPGYDLPLVMNPAEVAAVEKCE